MEEKLSEDNGTNFDTISATIEHIIPESSEDDKKSILNIGNLLILEKNLNEECENYKFSKKKSVYKKSNYHFVKDFMNKYSSNKAISIEERSRDIGTQLYGLITKNW
ncbi:hypothetical protein SORDD05_00252 [Streptococcus oralis]|uniref:GmrSD restriction endonucleases C-terminal domain-containing protein n=2 Tax=Streptococcus oralis TaxID=1303 RepID=A0A139MCK7_STROR|nr:hypothetical protein SORDD05_00252 [Streptococcus oralis]